ncbi:MAG: GC-type dockerin domain-anchored protein, partial [Phycisphaerales bacterium]|nr:GC-type dockerin domain-anchored protein [Phycisphaerales bacterium]
APTVTPAIVQNLASLPSLVTGVANMPADAGARFKWIKFSIPTDANDTTNKYVDIDTANSLEPMNDTNIALYDSNGGLKSLNDDIAPGWGAANPTGGNAAMSFGTGNFSRDYSAVNANMPAGDGRDGYLTAGTYYLQVSMCCAGYGNDRFWVVNDYVTNVASGDIPWAIRSNYTGCGPADVGQQGGIDGSDEHLDNNDFVVFINLFFTQSPLADLGKQGGVGGADGQWDNNDFIVFIDEFFNAPASCR